MPPYQIPRAESSHSISVVILTDNVYHFVRRHHGLHCSHGDGRGLNGIFCPNDCHPIRRVCRNRKDWVSEYHGRRLSMVSIGFTEKILKYSIKYRYRYRYIYKYLYICILICLSPP